MIKQETEQCEFVSKAKNNALLKRIQQECLLPQAEVALLKRGNDYISHFYINRYGLSEVAIDYLFATSNKRLIFAMIEKFGCKFHFVDKLIKNCKYKIVDEFFETHHLYSYPEFVDGCNDFSSAEVILKNLKTRGMSSVALMMAIRTEEPEVIAFLCEKAGHSARGQSGAFEKEKAYLTKSQLEAIARVADQQSFLQLKKIYSYKTYKFLREIYMFRFGSFEEVSRYISSRVSFTNEGKSAFFDCADPELIAHYCSRHGIEDWDTNLVGSAKVNDILNFLNKNWLSKRAEKVLLERNNEDEISAYIENHYFGFEEVSFIRNCSHEMVMKYINKHSLSDVAQVELFKRGNIVELFAFVRMHKLCGEAEYILSQIGGNLLYEAWYLDGK
jgi:hypothetical protein